MAQMHSFVSITVIPILARVNTTTGEIEYSPQSDEIPTAEQMCGICHVPMDIHSINDVCLGSTEVPDDLRDISDANPG